MKESGLEASTTHSRHKDYSRDMMDNHRGVEGMDMGSCREGGRGTGIVQDRGLEVVEAVL